VGLAAARGAPAAEPDDGSYRKLLAEFVVTVSKPGEPLETRVDYVALASQKGSAERLSRVRRSLNFVPPGSMTAAERTAWAINLYNLRVIELVVHNLRDSLTGEIIPSVRRLGPGRTDFFAQPGLRVDGANYTLDAFERKFLFGDFDRSPRAPRPAGLDPRLHFALVCAAAGCPALMPRPYRADSLEAHLDFAVRNALASPRHLRWDAERGTLRASEIFAWYRRDFEPQGPFAFIKRYAPAAVVKQIESRGLKDVEHLIPWDWSLNRYVHGDP
jgi:hypothetical protein